MFSSWGSNLIIADQGYWKMIIMNRTCTWFSTSVHTLLMRVEAILVPTTASIPEARAALTVGIEVPLQDKLGTSSFLFGKLANVHSCRDGWEGSDKEDHGEYQNTTQLQRHISLAGLHALTNCSLNNLINVMSSGTSRRGLPNGNKHNAAMLQGKHESTLITADFHYSIINWDRANCV